ncbi:MAG: uS2 family ribosomal protein, partial [Candidatus Uhrbacteria bacterium]|nr:uS2 family ribosomal protein [Candidatus Uhrbacteria bacterium]
IPGNDDAIGSIDLITKLVAEAVKEGKAKAMANAKAAVEARKSAEDDVKVSEVSKNIVDDLDDAMKDKLAVEAAADKKE